MPLSCTLLMTGCTMPGLPPWSMAASSTRGRRTPRWCSRGARRRSARSRRSAPSCHRGRTTRRRSAPWTRSMVATSTPCSLSATGNPTTARRSGATVGPHHHQHHPWRRRRGTWASASTLRRTATAGRDASRPTSASSGAPRQMGPTPRTPRKSSTGPSTTLVGRGATGRGATGTPRR